MAKKLNKTTQAFGLLFGDPATTTTQVFPVEKPVRVEQLFERTANPTNCYLVVKTGKSGTKINDLYNTSIWSEGREIKLTGEHRLQGAYLRSITEALKLQGIQGTMSIFKHTVEDADELINEHQKMMIKLAKGVDWKVVAKVNLQEKELDTVIGKLRDDYFKVALAKGFITGTNRAYRFTAYEQQKATLRYSQANKLINDLRLRFKHEQAAYIADRLDQYIEQVR